MRLRTAGFGGGVVVSLILVVGVLAASAADYPKNPITIVVAYPAGGVTDTLARMFAQTLSRQVKQSVVVVNKPGAGTALGTLEVIKANPDGHTLGFFSNALLASQYVLPEPVDLKGLEPVARFNLDPNVIGVSEKTPFNNLKDIVGFAKKNPKQLKVGLQSGTATAHLYLVAFMKMAGIDAEANYIAFKGGGDSKVALAGGHIDMTTDVFGILRPLVDAKKVRVVGVAAERRHVLYPEIPTLKEQGFDIAWGTWHGVFATKGTPPEILHVLEKAVEEVVKDREMLALMEKNQFPIDYTNRQEFLKFLAKEDQIYREISTEVGLYKPKK